MKQQLSAVLFAASAASSAPVPAPQVVSAVQLRAEPGGASQGLSGPINHWRFEVKNFPAGSPAATVLCIYPGHTGYRCAWEIEERPAKAVADVVHVRIADLDLGTDVVVRFATSGGLAERAVKLTNAPRLFHETEAVNLAGGGRHLFDGIGNPSPNMQLMTQRSVTHPALSTSGFALPTAVCDMVRAVWVGASATDPVFTSVFGPLQGTIAPLQAPTPDSGLTPDHSPEWLISFPMSAVRVQFIAHYEVTFRVGPCPHKKVPLTPVRRSP